MANICLKIRAIKTKNAINQAHEHNNPNEAEKLIDKFQNSKKTLSQNVNALIKTMRENKELDRKRSANEIQIAELVFTASPEFFRNKLELPQGWREFNDEQKNQLWKKHKPDPQKVEQFKKTALKMLKEQFTAEALINITLHTHETSPHVHALILPITKPTSPTELPRLSYEKIFGQAKGKKPRNGFEEWQDRAGEYFEKIGLERGQRGSLSTYKAPKIWNAETAEAKEKAKAEKAKIEKLIIQKALIDRYADRVFSLNLEENKKIAQAKELVKKGITTESLGEKIANAYANAYKRAEIERNANAHLRAEKHKATEQNARKKTDLEFSKMYEKAKKKDPEQAEKAFQKLKDLATPAERPKLAASPGPDLKALARPQARIETQAHPQPQETQQNAQESTESAFTGDEMGEAEPQPSKPFDKMTASEKMSYLKAKKAWEERENARRERLAKQKPKF